MYLITFGRKLGSAAIPIGYPEMLVSRQVGGGMYVSLYVLNKSYYSYQQYILIRE